MKARFALRRIGCQVGTFILVAWGYVQFDIVMFLGARPEQSQWPGQRCWRVGNFDMLNEFGLALLRNPMGFPGPVRDFLHVGT